MPRTKVPVPDVAEVAPGLWSNAIRAGEFILNQAGVGRQLASDNLRNDSIYNLFYQRGLGLDV